MKQGTDLSGLLLIATVRQADMTSVRAPNLMVGTRLRFFSWWAVTELERLRLESRLVWARGFNCHGLPLNFWYGAFTNMSSPLTISVTAMPVRCPLGPLSTLPCTGFDVQRVLGMMRSQSPSSRRPMRHVAKAVGTFLKCSSVGVIRAISLAVDWIRAPWAVSGGGVASRARAHLMSSRRSASTPGSASSQSSVSASTSWSLLILLVWEPLHCAFPHGW